MKRIIAYILLLAISVMIFTYKEKDDMVRPINKISTFLSIPNVQELGIANSGKKFEFNEKCNIFVDSDALYTYAKVFAKDLKYLTGYSINVKKGDSYKKGDILLNLDNSFELDDEGYRIDVKEDNIIVKAKTKEGIFYATRTLLQWIRQGYLIPEAFAIDYPKYEERSSLIDVARKYFSIEYIKNHIREISYLKYNYLYLHLTDNEGFRLECESYPEIVAEKHYTKKEIKEIVEFAAQYNITVIPEIEMPGHMAGALNVHTNWQLTDKNGNKNATRLDITNPEVYTFVEEIIEEYLPLFPGKYFHIGADEYIPVNEYINYPVLQQYAKEKYGNTAKPVDVYYGFINHVNDIIKKHGKTTRMWNDGLGPKGSVEVNNDIVVDVWLTNAGTYSAKELIKKGFTIGNSNTSKLYYVLGIDWASAKPQDLYETFDPYIFVNNEKLEGEPKNLGAKFQLWCDKADAETEEDLYTSLECIYRALAQKNWGSKKIVESYDDFKEIMNNIGSAPGYTHKEINIEIYSDVTPLKTAYDINIVEINLGQIYYINDIEIKKGDKVIDANIEVSVDGINYINAPGKGQFIRVNRDGIDNSYSIKVKGKLLPDNIALNKKVTVTTEYDKNTWPASYAVDGSLSTRWASFDTARSKGNESLTVDLGDVYEITGSAIYWETACPKAYDIQISMDGVSWSKIYEENDSDGGVDILDVNGKGRYISITATAFKTPYGISVFEFKVFGYK